MIDRVVLLAERLRHAGFDVSTSEVIDATAALEVIDLVDLPTVRACLRASLVKEPDPTGVFDRCFDATFRRVGAAAAVAGAGSKGQQPGAPPLGPGSLPSSGLAIDGAILRALLDDDDAALSALAEQAVALYAGVDDVEGSERYFLHRVLRAIDLSRMLSAAMQQLRRDGGLSDLELMLQRNELTHRLEEFRRRLAAEISRRLGSRSMDALDVPDVMRADELDLMALSRADREELRRVLRPLLRRLAVRIGRRRKLRSTGRLDPRRTIRRSLQAGGVPIDVVTRRRHPHLADVVVLCDVSGSVAEFAQFTFTMLNAFHAELRRVRSFAFVDGIAEVTDIIQAAEYEIAVSRLLERKGVVGLDGHSDYGAAFRQFAERHLADTVGAGTTVVITGDARGNYRDSGAAAFAQIAERARRIYWLNPEPESAWGTTDSAIDDYRRHCTSVHEVRTLAQLADVISEII
jgi:uncharacterized protein with von Willebrand factor type A (vWA) domain